MEYLHLLIGYVMIVLRYIDLVWVFIALTSFITCVVLSAYQVFLSLNNCTQLLRI